MTNSATVKSRKHEDVKEVVKKQAETRKTAGVGKTRQVLGLRLWRSWETPSKTRHGVYALGNDAIVDFVQLFEIFEIRNQNRALFAKLQSFELRPSVPGTL